jgi:hypothetical protein
MVKRNKKPYNQHFGGTSLLGLPTIYDCIPWLAFSPKVIWGLCFLAFRVIVKVD